MYNSLFYAQRMMFCLFAMIYMNADYLIPRPPIHTISIISQSLSKAYAADH